MPEFVHDIPPDQLAIWFTAIPVAAVILGILFIKPILRLLMGRSDPNINESIGYGTASFSLFYALLAGLLTVAAYQNKERVEQAIFAEASSLGVLYAGLNVYPEPARSEVKALLRDYTLFTIYADWPAHREGRILNGGTHRMDAIRQKLAAFVPATEAQQILHGETLRGFAELTATRQARLNGVITRLPDVLWFAVIVGAILNLLIIVMLRIRLVAHILLGSISAFFLGVVLYIIAILDDPLRGTKGLPPAAFELLWERQMVWDEGTQ
jgi:hypothetical protein